MAAKEGGGGGSMGQEAWVAATVAASVSAAGEATADMGRKETKHGRGGCRREAPGNWEPGAPGSRPGFSMPRPDQGTAVGPVSPSGQEDPASPLAPTSSRPALTPASAAFAGYVASEKPLHLSAPPLPGLRQGGDRAETRAPW